MRWLLVAIVLLSVGIIFFVLALLWRDNPQEAEFQKFREASTLNDFIEIARQTENKKLAAVSFYNAGTMGLNEFMADKNNSAVLRGAILYLQESLVKDPDFEKAKRNLEIALRVARENNLTNGFGLEPVDSSSDQNGQGEEGEAVEDGETEGGTEGTENPLPYSDEEGFGRDNEQKDY